MTEVVASDTVTAALGMAAIFIFAPMAGVAVAMQLFDVAGFAMATAAFLVALSNRD